MGDFDTMVLADPYTTTTYTYTLGANFGDCMTDTLTVSNPGGPIPPTICGYNTGQHMWVPASDSCNQINIYIRRARSYCSICYDPYISSTTTASSFGLGANAVATTLTATIGSYVTGVTTINPSA